ncbi:STAS domain-containing protein [Nocardioides bizhenqiangii]|uniref:STAS domain-containing protein n=1 Tax=Nocardioides bizhenqiangii TaxID=3095076 RepID=A0ABZ0ZQ75_9ACTN|nr:STAS domain-containing protein [Nocardioides sp. HM61]WQQ26373.1 STAS domain-containing protein [Nocardioides sp. HM61]
MSLVRVPVPVPDRDLLRLAGEIDLAQQFPLMVDISSRLRAQRQLIIDLSAVTFIDCSGLWTLDWARTRARDIGGDMALVGPCPALSRILVLTSLDGNAPLFPDVPTAADALHQREQARL